MNEESYKLKNIESCIIEKITAEAITNTYYEVLDMISSEIESNYDTLEIYNDYCDITEYVIDNIDSISEDDFDIDTIINEEIDVHEIIEDEYNKVMYK